MFDVVIPVKNVGGIKGFKYSQHKFYMVDLSWLGPARLDFVRLLLTLLRQSPLLGGAVNHLPTSREAFTKVYR